MMAGKSAVVAMSGGVDSSVAAALLVDQGYDVTGVMLKLWSGDSPTGSGCCSVDAADDARRVADTLGIPFYVLNLAERFRQTVVGDFHSAYASGTTPNPCVRCNQWIKFDAILEKADAFGAEVVATGHYARVRKGPGGVRLLRGVDRAKDQSYVLWMLDQDRLRRTRFPVGEMTKTETRAIAADLGLRTAAKPDSQDICFVASRDLGDYVATNVPEASVPGPIHDRSGRVVGEHQGVGRYTVGQRKGLGVSLGVPVFVTTVDARANTLVVGSREDLAVGSLRTTETSFVTAPPPPGTRVLVQHRAHGEVNAATLSRSGGAASELAFDHPVEAVAPGQSAVFYSAAEPDEVIGGGIIEATGAATRVA